MVGQFEFYPVVIAGGSGTRLWPLSRTKFPKQFHKFFDTDSLLQATLKRLSSTRTHTPLIICNQEHRFIVTEQLQQIGLKSTLILEPALRNTAPAIALGALHLAKIDPNAVMLILPADHWIADSEQFMRSMDLAILRAQAGDIVTFGITPTAPATGYGYIEVGPVLQEFNGHVANQLSRFIEKPDAQTAEAYFQTKKYLWNSGMFCCTAKVYLEALKVLQPEIWAAAEAAYTKAIYDQHYIHIDTESFSASPNISIDYAIMEEITKTNPKYRITATVIPVSMDWSDVGSWSSIWQIAEKDEQNNAVNGDVLLHNSQNCYIHAEDRLVAAVGIDNCIIIETDDAVLVANKNEHQTIGKIVDKLKSNTRSEHVEHMLVHKPWGSYQRLVAADRYQAKIITINPHASISLQMHQFRAEHWIIVKGTARITRGEEVYLLHANQSTYIPQGVVHRLENPTDEPLELIEVQSGTYLGEDDIVRLQDQYGRIDEKALVK